jgi:hypothetical protein
MMNHITKRIVVLSSLSVMAFAAVGTMSLFSAQARVNPNTPILAAEPTTDTSRQAAITQAFQQLLRRVPNQATIDYYIGRMKTGFSVEDLWTAVGTSPERETNFGFFAPIKRTYSTPLGNVTEQCFGASGPKCDGAPKSNPVWKDTFVRVDGVEMGYIVVSVSVGSIAHDNACKNIGGKGQYCDGLPAGIFTDILGTLPKILTPAATEWSKAVWNTYDDRMWTSTFGPYPKAKALRDQFSDDLRSVPARAIKLPAIVPAGKGPLTINYQYDETKRSLMLRAPTGTPLDDTDAQSCLSGSFKSGVGGIGYGVCN